VTDSHLDGDKKSALVTSLALVSTALVRLDGVDLPRPPRGDGTDLVGPPRGGARVARLADAPARAPVLRRAPRLRP